MKTGGSQMQRMATMLGEGLAGNYAAEMPKCTFKGRLEWTVHGNKATFEVKDPVRCRRSLTKGDS